MSILDIAADNMVWVDKIQTYHPAWLFFTLFILLGLYAWIRIYYGSIVMHTFESSFSYQVATRLFKDNSVLQKQLDSVLLFFYILCAGLLLYVAEIRFGFEPYGITGALLYLFNLALLLVVLIARVVLIYAAGFFFNSMKIYREYLYNMFIYNKIVGLTALPLLLFVLYTRGLLSEVLLWITIVSISVLLIMRIIRAIIFSFKKDVSIFYMFLYLCALEIAPLALLYRWLEGIL